jgi:hypothetical protein
MVSMFGPTTTSAGTCGPSVPGDDSGRQPLRQRIVVGDGLEAVGSRQNLRKRAVRVSAPVARRGWITSGRSVSDRFVIVCLFPVGPELSNPATTRADDSSRALAARMPIEQRDFS